MREKGGEKKENNFKIPSGEFQPESVGENLENQPLRSVKVPSATGQRSTILPVEIAVPYFLVPLRRHCQTHYPLGARGVRSAVSVDTVALKRARRS